MAMILLVSFIPVFLVSSIIYYQFRISYHEKVYAHLKELVHKHEQHINDFLNEKLADIRFLSESHGYTTLSNKQFLEQKLALLQKEYGVVFVDLGVINAQGSQIAYAGPFMLGQASYSNTDWFQQAMNSEYVISDVFLGLRGLPHFIIAVKKIHDGKPWILRATIDFVAFNNLVENIRIGKTGFAFILNREGELQTKPALEFIPTPGCYGYFFDCSKELTEDIKVEERIDDGQKNIYVAAFLKNKDWLLVYKQVYADAFSELNRAQKISIFTLFAGGVGLIIMAFFLSRRMVRRLKIADSEKEMMNQQVIETGKLASVGELAAGIAHEINNPVAIMVEEAGWIQDLLEEEEFHGSENLDEFERALKQINTQGKRCKAITHKLLSFARKTDSRIHNIVINEMIEDVVGLSAQRAKYSKVALKISLEENLPEIMGSASEMQQVFLNLINNALDALDKKGGEIKITAQQKDDAVQISLADDGPGIPKANLARIFDPFFTTKMVGKGTGLGLSICYGIINRMGGKIEVQSMLDHGTTFTISIPIATEQAPLR
ncbi:MAG: ATP-binding protein [Deltaproteobacteria bacterium]|nr:ATP-binding protein [Deltaproteobacteria bacterium]